MKRFLIACVLGLSACQIDDADVPKFGGPCSNGCANGFRCDKDLDACVPEEEPTDAGFPDAGFPDAGNPELLTFTIETATQAAGASVNVELDETFTLRWTTQDLTACSISSGVGNVNENGNVDLSLAAAGTTNYVLTCTGNGAPVSSEPVSAIVNSVLDGDLIVTTNEDLDAAIGITEITGNVVIDGASITGLVQLEDLVTIGGDLRYTDSGSIADFALPALTSIGGSLVVTGDVTLDSISLPVLATVALDVHVFDLTALETLSLPALTSIGRDLYLGTYEYPQFPLISDFDTGAALFSALPLPSLASVDLGLLETIGRDFDCEDALALADLTLPSLTSIGAMLAVLNLGDNHAGDVTLALPALESVSTVIVQGNNHLATIDLGSLIATERLLAAENVDFDAPILSNLASPLYQIYRVVGNDFWVGWSDYVETGDLLISYNGENFENTAITTLDLRSLTTVPTDFWLDGTSVQTLTFDALVSVEELTLGDGGTTRTLSFPSLTTLGTSGLRFEDQPTLETVSFPVLATIEGGGMTIGNLGGCDTLTFPSLTDLTGPVELDVGTNLTTFSLASTTLDALELGNVGPAVLAGLGVVDIVGDFDVNTTFTGTALTGMEQLATVGGDVNFYAPNLDDLTGMDGLTTIGGYLNLSGNLQATTGLGSLTSVDSIDVTSDQLVVLDLPALTTITGVGGFDPIDATFFQGSEGALTTIALPSLQSIEGPIFIQDAPLESVNLGSVTTISSIYLIRTALVNMNDFCGITAIESEISFVGKANTPLADFSGLQNLTSIGSNIFVRDWPAMLPVACQLAQIRDNVGGVEVVQPDITGDNQADPYPLPAPCALDTGACP